MHLHHAFLVSNLYIEFVNTDEVVARVILVSGYPNKYHDTARRHRSRSNICHMPQRGRQAHILWGFAFIHHSSSEPRRSITLARVTQSWARASWHLARQAGHKAAFTCTSYKYVALTKRAVEVVLLQSGAPPAWAASCRRSAHQRQAAGARVSIRRAVGPRSPPGL
jgi:hypothetical protein